MAEAAGGTDKVELKKLLTLSKKQPVNCGIGMTKDGAVMQLDRVKQPKALVKELEKTHKDMKSPLWGTAFVDMDEDPKLVILTLNKAASGVASKLKKTLKGTGFSKVEIRLEDGTVAEKADEDEEGAPPPLPPAAAGAAQAPAAPPVAANAAPDTAPPDAGPAAPVAGADQPAPPQAAPANTGALTRRLTDLVKRMIPAMSANPTRAAALKGLATQAQASLKSGDLGNAGTAIDRLEQALSQGAQPNGAAPNGAAANAAQNGAAPAPPNMAALGKARMAWSAARRKVESEVDKLHGEMTKAYQGHGFGADLDKFFRAKVEPIMTSLDESLVHKLDEVTGNTDPANHAKLVSEARQIVQKYESFLSSEPLIAKLDANPFVPLQIGKTLEATLTALGRAIV